jgi:nucleoside-diphosphate-sugar epimerase
VGFDGSFTYDPSQPTGMQQKLASSILAEEWGWQADTHLEDGLKETYEYFKEINK